MVEMCLRHGGEERRAEITVMFIQTAVCFNFGSFTSQCFLYFFIEIIKNLIDFLVEMPNG